MILTRVWRAAELSSGRSQSAVAAVNVWLPVKLIPVADWLPKTLNTVSNNGMKFKGGIFFLLCSIRFQGV